MKHRFPRPDPAATSREITGTIDPDTLTGTTGPDTIYAGSGDDVLRGLGGADLLYGDFGADTVLGGAERDWIFGGLGDDLLEGGAGDDRLSGDAGNDTLRGGDGDDRLIDTSGEDHLYGGPGDDTIVATIRSALVSGGPGHDALEIRDLSSAAWSGAITINLATGVFDLARTTPLQRVAGIEDLELILGLQPAEITLTGTEAANHIAIWRSYAMSADLGAGNDSFRIWGFRGYDNYGLHEIDGGPGDDTIYGALGDDILRGGDGDDAITGAKGDDLLEGGAGNDVFLPYGALDATDDIAFLGQDTIFGGEGDDTIYASPDSDIIDGGPGHDVLTFELLETGQIVDLVNADVSRGWFEGDSATGIDEIVGTDWVDQLRDDDSDTVLRGGLRTDRLYGRGGDDTLLGELGVDAIYGNDGVDVMTGGTEDPSQRDRFIYFAATDSGVGAGNRDIITDFVAGTDRIELSRIDADLTQGFKQRFDFIGNAAFSGTGGELRYEQVGGNTIVQADRDGDGMADFEIELTGLVALTESDFLI